MRFLLVCIGGAVGSGARYLLSLWLVAPYSTLAVNLIGSFLIGVVLETTMSVNARLLIATGLLGGFTTYSTFNHDTLELLRTGAWLAALLNIALTLFGCLIAGGVGVWVARAIRG